MVLKILIVIFFFEIKESKITRGHNFTLVKKQSRLDLRKLGEGRGVMTVIYIVIGMFTSNPMIPQYLNNNRT